MLDPIQIPMLLKAVDFIFDEGRKILEERRERRKLNDSPKKAEEKKEITPASEEKPVETKDDLLKSKVDDLLWRTHEEEVQHLMRLLETYSRNYRHAQEQYSKWGSALVPPIIVHSLTEAEDSIAQTLEKLEAVLSKVYKKDINPKN